MKVWAISDLHLAISANKPMDIFGNVWVNYLDKIFDSWRENVANDDVVVLAGDHTWAMKIEDAAKDFGVLASLPGKKVIIRGNHDYWWKSISAVREILPPNFFAIQNDAIKIGNFVFFGSRGWSVPEKNFQSAEDEKIFKREVIRLNLALDAAKKIASKNDELIAIMHYPPLNSKREDSEFFKILESSGVKKVIYGHLHGKACRKDAVFEKNGIKFFLTSCDLVENKLVSIV